MLSRIFSWLQGHSRERWQRFSIVFCKNGIHDLSANQLSRLDSIKLRNEFVDLHQHATKLSLCEQPVCVVALVHSKGAGTVAALHLNQQLNVLVCPCILGVHKLLNAHPARNEARARVP